MIYVTVLVEYGGSIMRILLILFTSFWSMQVLAYGHLIGVNYKQYRKNFLISNLVLNQDIYFCIDNHYPDDFSNKSLELQTRKALEFWIKPLKEKYNLQTKVLKTICSDKKLDIMIKIAIHNSYNHAFFRILDLENHSRKDYGVIQFNYPKKVGIRNFDFLKWSQVSPKKWEKFLNNLNDQQLGHQYILDNTQWFPEVDHYSFKGNTWSTMIHEVGHAFGLCDLYMGSNKKFYKGRENCDENHFTGHTKGAVMNNTKSFYLTQDDIDGVFSLYERYLDEGVELERPKYESNNYDYSDEYEE